MLTMLPLWQFVTQISLYCTQQCYFRTTNLFFLFLLHIYLHMSLDTSLFHRGNILNRLQKWFSFPLLPNPLYTMNHILKQSLHILLVSSLHVLFYLLSNHHYRQSLDDSYLKFTLTVNQLARVLCYTSLFVYPKQLQTSLSSRCQQVFIPKRKNASLC